MQHIRRIVLYALNKFTFTYLQ